MSVLEKRSTLIVLVLALAAACAAIALAPRPSVDSTLDGTRAVSADIDWAYEVRDERQLVGAADDVFVGKVVGQVGTSRLKAEGLPEGEAGPVLPRTQFSVRIEETVKGTLDGTVTVSQEGGYVELAADSGPDKGKTSRVLQLMEHDPLLKPGQSYLFSTSYDAEEDHHQVTAPGYGDIPIGDGPGEKQRGPLLEKFSAAKAQQVDPMVTEVAHGRIPQKFLEGEDVAHHE